MRWLGQRVILLLLLASFSSQSQSQEQSLGYGLGYIYGTPNASPLSLSDLFGNFTKLSDNKGKVVIVNFWATWCPPCIKELPALSALQRHFRSAEVEVFGVNLGETPEAVKQFVEALTPPIQFKVLLAPTPEDIAGWEIKALPQSYIINKSGQLEYSAIGPRDFAHPEIIKRVQALVDRL
ncbi:MAG: TlpA family protein disulfide reductase [Acidiferrobacterales bacterium]|nr:TlpA family protein disulfide reductase [Acidiferrobacterales bacterium]